MKGKVVQFISLGISRVKEMPENSRGLSSAGIVVRVGLFFSIFSALSLVISVSANISAIHSCNKGRFIMNSTWGFITNGPENYREDSYCVWLIEGIYLPERTWFNCHL